MSPFTTVFLYNFLDNFLPFPSNLEFLSAKSLSLEESKFYHLQKGLGIVLDPILMSASYCKKTFIF